MTILFNIGRNTVKHAIKKFVDSGYTPRVETLCGKIIDAPWVNEESRHPNCTRCVEIINEIVATIDKFKCNLCDYTCKGIAYNARPSHIENLHPSKIKSDSDKRESTKLFTIIFNGRVRGHELQHIHKDGKYQGSCICNAKFEPVLDMNDIHRQFTEHVREEGVLPIGF